MNRTKKLVVSLVIVSSSIVTCTIATALDEPACCIAVEPTVSEAEATQNVDPLVCTLTTKEKRDRRQQVTSLIASAAISVDEFEVGYRIAFETGHSLDILEFIELERECCSFFEFSLIFPANGAPMVLEIAGPEGSKEFSRKLISGITEKASSADSQPKDACCAVK